MSTNSIDMLKVSSNPEWATPQYVFDRLDEEFHFTLDVCADETNRKCERYFGRGGIAPDGLAERWEGETCWMNPPYGRAITDWVRKAHESTALDPATVVVGLVPCRTDTRWWQDHVMQATEIRFVRGRIQFGDSGQSAPFANAIAVWGGRRMPRLSTIDFAVRRPNAPETEAGE